MVNENFHGRLGVRVIRRFEFQSGDPDFREEIPDKALQVRKTQVLSNNQSFHLVELSEMSCIQGLVSEHSVNREQFGRSENSGFFVLVSDLLEISRAYSGCVGSEDISSRLFNRPVILPTIGFLVFSLETLLVDFLHSFYVVLHFLGIVGAEFRFGEEEGVVGISCWVLLRLEERVEVPER